MNISDCDAVILCGGLGKRLQSVVSDVPKVMAKVDGKPFLDFIIENLKSQGIQRIILCTGYKANLVEQYYRDKDFGIVIDFSTEEEPLGTGGAIKNAQEICSSNPFFVLNGDSLLSTDLTAFLAFHQNNEALASICVSQAKEAKDFGSIALDQSHRIVSFQEKVEQEQAPLVNAGIYCFNQDVFSFMPELKNFSLETDFFPELVGEQFYGYQVRQEFMDIGTPQPYESAKQKLQEGQKSDD